ncbi:MAG: hypothetical protein ACK5KR_01205 [Breznakia sp.]
MITFSLTMIFTILFASSTMLHTIMKQMNQDFLLYPVYSNGSAYNNEDLLINDLKLEIYDKDVYKIRAQEMFMDIHNQVENGNVQYQKTSIDMSMILSSIVDL